MKKHTIWQNIDFEISDWQDYLDYKFGDEVDEMSDYEKLEAIQDLNDCRLDDERINLDIPVCIIGIADVGRWNGRVQGYQIYDNLKDILYTNAPLAKWCVEGDTLKAKMVHHDGTNYIEYYAFQSHLNGSDKFLSDILEEKEISRSRFYRYCKSAGKLVKKVYGWR
jgi:hypothetical protein